MCVFSVFRTFMLISNRAPNHCCSETFSSSMVTWGATWRNSCLIFCFYVCSACHWEYGGNYTSGLRLSTSAEHVHKTCQCVEIHMWVNSFVVWGLPSWTFLDSGRKSEKPKETHTDTGIHANLSNIQGNYATPRCATLQYYYCFCHHPFDSVYRWISASL